MAKTDEDGVFTNTAAHGTRFPYYGLKDSLLVPKMVHERAGGSATPEQLAAYLGYKGTKNGAFLSRIGAARQFDLLGKAAARFVVSPLAKEYLSPVYPADREKALITAFFNVDLFKRIYDEYKGRALPSAEGMKNALLNMGVAPARVHVAFNSLMESADEAGFFSTKAGNRSHFILPSVSETSGQFVSQTPDDSLDVQSPPTGTLSASAAAAEYGHSWTLTDVKAKYLSTLIALFEEKSKSGQVDEQLMDRIERLLGEQAKGPA